MKKFSVPCWFGDVTSPFNLYVGEPAPNAHPLWAQAQWLHDERGGEIPAEVYDAFAKLHEIALENHTSFEELCVSALGQANASQAPNQDGPEAADPAGSAAPAPGEADLASGPEAAQAPAAGPGIDLVRLPELSRFDSVAAEAVRHAVTACPPGEALDTRGLLLAVASAHVRGRWERIWLYCGRTEADIAQQTDLHDPAVEPLEAWQETALTVTCAQSLRDADRISRVNDLPIAPGLLVLGLLANPASAASRALGAEVTIPHADLLRLTEEELLGVSGYVSEL